MIRLKEDKQVKYLGEGKVGVYKNGKLVERYELEKGDDLMENVRRLSESSFIQSSEFDQESLGFRGSWTDESDYNLSVYDSAEYINKSLIILETKDSAPLWSIDGIDDKDVKSLAGLLTFYGDLESLSKMSVESIKNIIRDQDASLSTLFSNENNYTYKDYRSFAEI